MPYRLYGDESGNTGPDLFAPDQPMYVLCFMLVERDNEDALKQATETARDLTRPRYQGEFKFSRLRTWQRGFALIEALGRAITTFATSVHVGQVEKRFQACAMIVETFLDPTYNEAAPPQNAAEVRETLANALYDMLDDRLLSAFVTAVRMDAVDEIRNLGGIVARRAILHPNRTVNASGQAIRAGLGEFFRYGERGRA